MPSLPTEATDPGHLCPTRSLRDAPPAQETDGKEANSKRTSLQRRLAAILAADMVGFARQMGADEAGTLARLAALRADILAPLLAEHHGRLFKTMGDGFLAASTSTRPQNP